jgi:hypothetical protein
MDGHSVAAVFCLLGQAKGLPRLHRTLLRGLWEWTWGKALKQTLNALEMVNTCRRIVLEPPFYQNKAVFGIEADHL